METLRKRQSEVKESYKSTAKTFGENPKEPNVKFFGVVRVMCRLLALIGKIAFGRISRPTVGHLLLPCALGSEQIGERFWLSPAITLPPGVLV